MRKATAQAVLSIPLILLGAVAVGWAGSQGGQRFGAVPVFALAPLLVLWLGYGVMGGSFEPFTATGTPKKSRSGERRPGRSRPGERRSG